MTGGDGAPREQGLPEITVKAVLLGVLLSAVLGGANAYLGLKVGLTVSASVPAAVISMALLRAFRRHNILENNIVQTSASAGESLAAGVIFTLPALILLGHWQGFPFLPTMAIALCGGILGVLFTVPLRRALIIEADLKFPEGVATGEVLKAGYEKKDEAGGEGGGAKRIAIGAIAAALLKLAQSGLKAAQSSVQGSLTAGGSVFGFGTDLSPALLGVGFIVGPLVGILLLTGGAISWLIGIPVFMATADPAELAAIVGTARGYDAAFEVWSARIRYMGVGAMVIGGAWALLSLAKFVKAGIQSSMAAVRSRQAGSHTIPRTERDMPVTWVLRGTLALAAPIFVVYMLVVDRTALGVSGDIHLTAVAVGTVFALAAGFLFASVAGYMAGLVGSSNNPISGVTIATLLAISLILYWILGADSFDAEARLAGAAAAILVGAVVACAAAIAGDNMQDLKAGRIVGATPWKQQVMQVIGVAAGAVAVAPVLGLLFEAYGLGGVFPREGMDPNEMLQAPQATLMSSVAGGVFSRDLPWGMISIGAAIAAAVIALDETLKARGSSVRVPVLAVAVGIYLPIELEVPMFAGGMIAWLVARAVSAGRSGDAAKAAKDGASRRGLLFASGLITGEALIGIMLAIPFAATQSTDVMRIIPPELVDSTLTAVIGAASGIAFVVWLYRTALGRRGASAA